MHDLLITNAKLVNEARISECDILISNQRIEQIGADLQKFEAKRVVDAKGNYVIPGMIDDQVHFREPGLTHKGDIATESLAAIAGGITSFMDMPNVKPPTLSLELLDKKYEAAHQRARANYAFYMGASNDNIEVLKQAPIDRACGIKVFMGASTGNMLVDDDDVLDAIFKYAPVPIITHCEDSPLINENLKKYQQQYGDDIPIEFHPLIRSEEACYRSSSKAVKLAKKHGSQLHILHLTTARELELFTKGNVKDKSITAEVCVHHLFFSEKDYAEKGSLIKCNPAVKTEQDHQGLLKGVQDDLIDVIATDHAPHTWEEKQGNYMTAPAGLPLVQHALIGVLEHMHDGVLSIEKIVEKTSHNVAIRFNVAERGFVREGYFADLAIIDVNKPHTVTKESVLYKCGWSPFEGKTFRSSIAATILNGQVVYESGAPIDEPFFGKQLTFDR
ncbi:MAG: dihydroorotase [Gammaproteobacteria bacterium]|nr:MAG: dihydroorotase [Gammaproteobacteria bacterium]